MSYTPTTWATGDTITATKLNKMEQGIAGAGSALFCNSSFSQTVGDYVLDKTVQEIYDALLAGTPVYIKFQYGTISNYVGTLYLAPVVKVYNYDNTGVIRICALKPYGTNDKDNMRYLFTPSVLIYSATGTSQYPVFYTTVEVTNSSLATGGVD